ncbi:MAG: hypothetical protein LBM68_02410 [Bacteroidales bacterium]|jgi:hypothetical protein|nr:hypothetical protein [Bacteroidales bacterium]
MRKTIDTGNALHYEEWLSIELRHEYFGNTPCPATLVPDEETAYLLKRNNILWKTSMGQCLLLTEHTSNLSADETAYLRFNIQPIDGQFHYVTQVCYKDEAFSVADTNMVGVWKSIVIDVAHIIKNKIKHMTINIKARNKYIEYLCIPKYGKADLKLRMIDDTNYFSFVQPPEKISLFAMPVVWRFVSKEKIPLRKRVEAKIKLCEIRDYGERIICNMLPLPHSEQFSPVSPNDTITTFFYY